MRAVVAEVMAARLAWMAPEPAPDHFRRGCVAAEAGEAFTTVLAGCGGCDWSETGREAAALRVSLDGKYSQHILLARGETVAEYRIALGPVAKGAHRLTVDRDPTLSARRAGPATIDVHDVRVLYPGSTDFTALSMAPFVYAR